MRRRSGKRFGLSVARNAVIGSYPASHNPHLASRIPNPTTTLRSYALGHKCSVAPSTLTHLARLLQNSSIGDFMTNNSFLANHMILLEPEGPKVLRNVNLYGKAMLGGLLARMVTGSEERMEVDENWRASWLEWHNPELGIGIMTCCLGCTRRLAGATTR